MKNLLSLMVVFVVAVILGGCASVEQNTQEQNTAQNQLRTKGIIFNVPSFIQEAANGNLDNVKLFVQGGMNVNAKSNETALTAACYYNKPEVVKYLVESGADVDLGSYYDVPLIAAVRGGSYDIVKFLIEHGANPNVKGYASVTPLYIAAEQGKSEIATLLLQYGAEVHYIQPNTGNTILMACAKEALGNLPTTEVLVKAGANVNYKNPTGMSVLDWAISRRKFDVAKYLISQGADPNDGLPEGTAPRTLLSAIAWGSPEMVKYLMEQGVDINSKAFGQMPVVIWCAKNMLESMAITLVEFGAKTDVTFNGSSLIDYAISNKEEGLIKKLDPNFDLNKVQTQVVDPNILSQQTQIEDIMGGEYYKAQHNATVDNAVQQAIQTNTAVSEAANQSINPNNVQDAVGPQGAGNVQEAKAVSSALKQQGTEQSQELEYPVDQEKLEKEIDAEIKNIESKYSNGNTGMNSLNQEEDNWYQPVTTPAKPDTIYDSPVGKPNQTTVPQGKVSTPYQYVTPNTRNAELAPEATDVINGRDFEMAPKQVKEISADEYSNDGYPKDQPISTNQPGNVDQNEQLAAEAQPTEAQPASTDNQDKWYDPSSK